jgi:hypothetical protein
MIGNRVGTLTATGVGIDAAGVNAIRQGDLDCQKTIVAHLARR